MTVAQRVTPWDPAAKRRLVTADGTALHVRDSGAGQVTLVLAHGWTLDHTSWDEVVAHLPGVRIVRYDHRGHGGSAPAPAGTATIAQVADDLAELIADRVPEGPIVLVGHSMGGMAAMALAERQPRLFADRIAAVGLVATSCGGLADLTLGLPRWLARRVITVERRLGRRVARSRRPTLMIKTGAARPGVRWLLFGRGARKADVAVTAAQIGRCHPASMVGFRASLDEHDRRAALAAFRRIPVTVLAGGADRLTDVSHARAIAAELPNARLAVYPGAGHMLPYERAADVAAHLTTLIDRVGGTSAVL
ncbi:MAG TPA: alpha/beta hydrolase [Pseudonocardiaceae bacterium]